MTRTVCGRCEWDKCKCKTIRATAMTRDDIIGWMQEVGAKKSDLTPQTYDGFVDLFQRFAALVAAAEREACAKVCEEDGLLWGQRYAAAIRTRGET